MERMASAARFGQRRPGEDPRSRYRDSQADDVRGLQPEAGSPAAASREVPAPAFAAVPAAAAAAEGGKKKGIQGGWVWIPLSFIFMLLGVVVGFQIALSMRPKQPVNPFLEAWDMTLQVKRTGEELAVTWDPLSPAVRNATRGALIIQSRDETRTIDLRGTQLQGGSVIYRGVPDRVIFRLEVYPRERMVVSEIAEFQNGK